jgi:thiol-disulfide isomerase/thioredoxin
MIYIKSLCRTAAAFGYLLVSLQALAIDGKLELNSAKPQAGATIRFNYHTSDQSGNLRGALIYYSPKDVNHSFAEDIILNRQASGSYQGSFLLPKNAIAFAIKFSSGNAVDSNNGKGYLYPVFTGGEPVKGSDAGLALFYAYPARLGFTEKRDAAIGLFLRAIKQCPAESLRFEHHYYRLLALKYKEAAYPEIENRATAILTQAHPSVEQYQMVMTLYQMTHNFIMSDSILKAGSKKFAGSNLAIMQFDKEFNQYDSIPNMLRIYNAFTKAFNVNELSSQAAETYSFWSSFIGYRYLLRKDIPRAIYYTGQIIAPKLTGYRAFYLDYIAAAMLDNQTRDTTLVDSLVMAAFNSIQQVKQHPEAYRLQGETTSEFFERFKQENEAPVMDACAKVMALKAKYGEALAYQEKVIDITQWNNPAFNEHYLEYLEKCGQMGKAFEKAQLIFPTGNTNPRFRELMKLAFVHEKGSEKGYAQLLASMEDPIIKQLRDSISKQLLRIAAIPFSLSDLNGHRVSLDSLHGKVVVLDFWSTWCSPCKAALPTMQRAVNKYRSDTGIVFLFVDTWETVPQETRLKMVNKLIEAKNYSFTVLLDKNRDLEKRDYEMASDYEIKGLPTKIIINKQGNITFRNIGFDGNEDKLFNEITEMIEMARQ